MDTAKDESNNLTPSLVEQYVSDLNEKEKHALSIAERNLKSSFDLEKSIGFLKFQELNKEK